MSSSEEISSRSAIVESGKRRKHDFRASVNSTPSFPNAFLNSSPLQSVPPPHPPLLANPPPSPPAPAGKNVIDHDYFNSFPPGYRFKPTDEELVLFYLKPKVANQILPHNRIVEVNLYRHNPENLAEEFKECGEAEWFFFTPRDRKYKNGSRPNRAAGDGYWKATGADRAVKSKDEVIGYRKALVFYVGKAPKGDKTNWIMHEFRVNDAPPTRRRTPDDMRLDDWVLCRIYKKPEKNNKKNSGADVDSSPMTPNTATDVTDSLDFKEERDTPIDNYEAEDTFCGHGFASAFADAPSASLFTSHPFSATSEPSYAQPFSSYPMEIYDPDNQFMFDSEALSINPNKSRLSSEYFTSMPNPFMDPTYLPLVRAPYPANLPVSHFPSNPSSNADFKPITVPVHGPSNVTIKSSTAMSSSLSPTSSSDSK